MKHTHTHTYIHSLTEDGVLDDVRAEAAAASDRLAAVSAQVADCDDNMSGLQREKELQQAAGGELAELTASSDELSKTCVSPAGLFYCGD